MLQIQRWFDEQRRPNIYIPPHESGARQIVKMQFETFAGGTEIVEGVSQDERALIIIVNLDGIATPDEWVVLDGKDKNAPRLHSQLILSAQP